MGSNGRYNEQGRCPWPTGNDVPQAPVYQLQFNQQMRNQCPASNYPNQQHQNYELYPQQQQYSSQPVRSCPSSYSTPSMQGTSNFIFNPNAKPFEPRGGIPSYGMAQHSSKQYEYGGNYNSQSTLMTSYYSANVDDQAEFDDLFRTFGQPKKQYQMSQEMFGRMNHSPYSVAIQEILVGLEQVLGDNSEVAIWGIAIKERLTEMPVEALQIVFLLICEMAYSLKATLVEGGDPQYTLSVLLKELLLDDDNFLFKVFLDVVGSVVEQGYCVTEEAKANMCVFTAELYDKLTLKNGTKVNLLGMSLCTQANYLVNRKCEEETLKSVVRALKLTGSSLELEDSEVQSAFNIVLTRIDGIANGTPTMSEPVRRQIKSLIAMKKKNWGRTVCELDDDESRFIEEQMQRMGTSSKLVPETVATAEDDALAEQDLKDAEILEDYGKFFEEEESQLDDAAEKMAAEVDKLTLETEEERK